MSKDNLEAWMALHEAWAPALKYLRDREAECMNKIVSVNATADMVAVRSLQAELAIIKRVVDLPERKIIEIKQKEANTRNGTR